MTKPTHDWPLPRYDPGPKDHLHALGVIAITFASLQANLDILYFNCANRGKLPRKLAELYYFSLDEQKRIEAIKTIFRSYETDLLVIETVDNLLLYITNGAKIAETISRTPSVTRS
jgi:hypothetical protein